MTISKRSWHYRLYRYMGNVPKGPRYILPWTKATRDDVDPPSSLCPYAWSIGLGLVGTAFLIVCATPVAVVLAPFYLLFRALLWTDATIGLGRLRAARAARKAQRAPTPATAPPVRVKHGGCRVPFIVTKVDGQWKLALPAAHSGPTEPVVRVLGPADVAKIAAACP